MQLGLKLGLLFSAQTNRHYNAQKKHFQLGLFCLINTDDKCKTDSRSEPFTD